MFNNFLYNFWRQGTLAGPAPELAYNLQVGLGTSMTPIDILNGMMNCIDSHCATCRVYRNNLPAASLSSINKSIFHYEIPNLQY